MIRDAKCKRCLLYKGRKTVCVPGRGNPNAEILFLAQAPGEMEDDLGEALIGPSGQLLEYAIKTAGITSYYLDNVVRCWPPGNRTPTAAEMKTCSIYIEEVIDRMPNLKMIVALGNIALRYLTGKMKIMSRAGNPESHQIGDRTMMILPCYHPAFILRDDTGRYIDKFEAIIKSVPTLLFFNDAATTEIYTGWEAYHFIKRMSHRDRATAFDFETTSLDPNLGSILWTSFYNGHGGIKPTACKIDHPRTIEAVKEFLASKTPKIIQHLPMEYGWCVLPKSDQAQTVYSIARARSRVRIGVLFVFEFNTEASGKGSPLITQDA